MRIFGGIFESKQDPQKVQIRNNLLKGIWRFNSPEKLAEPKALSYFYHYERLLEDPRLIDDSCMSLRASNTQSADVIDFVRQLQQTANQPLTAIRSSIQSNPPSWLGHAQAIDPSTIDKAITFASRLWLFTRLDLTDDSVSLAQAAKIRLGGIKGLPTNNYIWLEFSAETLKRNAGIRISWTSDLSEHLTFESSSVIRVFTHASALERFERSDEHAMYPAGFLKELRRTLNLLWPMEDPPVEKYVRSLEKYENVDVEASMGHDEKFNLQSYPIFGERLAKIQKRLEAVQTRRGASLGFKIAVWGIVLTALSGLISAITGIMQVWASFKSLDQP